MADPRLSRTLERWRRSLADGEVYRRTRLHRRAWIRVLAAHSSYVVACPVDHVGDLTDGQACRNQHLTRRRQILAAHIRYRHCAEGDGIEPPERTAADRAAQ